MTTGPTTRDASAPAGARDLLERATALPSLREKYTGLGPSPDWQTLPPLTKEEFNTALEELRAPGGSAGRGAYLFASGGTMSAPRLSLLPGHLFVPDIADRWAPLTSQDVLVNLFTPGRTWSAHYFYNTLAAALGATVIPFGDVGDDELDTWLDYFEDQGVTALAGTPSTLRRILAHCAATGRTPGIRTVIWVGEAYDSATASVVSQVLPEAAVWGNYGSTETWVIGTNGPTCPTDVFHPLPYQHVELESDGAVLVTCCHPDAINPLLRYQVGDRAEFTRCPCGDDSPALRVLGRADSHFKFLGMLVSPEELVGLALTVEDVQAAQVVLLGAGTDRERMEIRVRPKAAERPGLRQQVWDAVVFGNLDLGYVIPDIPEAITVTVVSTLAVNARTAKTPVLVREDAR